MSLDRVLGRWVLMLLPVALVACGCTFFVADDDVVTVVSYNVENLFDAVDDGSEYPEYTSDSGWDQRDVDERLRRLSRALSSMRPHPDVVVLIEVENVRLIDTLVDDHLTDSSYPYAAFAKAPESAVGLGALARYPIVNAVSHQPRADEGSLLRPILELTVETGHGEIVVLANHWKSKRGGAAATEELRRESARLLTRRIAELAILKPDTGVLVVGDFNESPSEYHDRGEGYPTAIMPADVIATLLDSSSELPADIRSTLERQDALVVAPATDVPVVLPLLDGTLWPVLVNLWDTADAQGSYVYDGTWQRIDSVFVTDSLVDGTGLERRDFGVLEPSGCCDALGHPLSVDQGGLSDHLPVFVSIGWVD